MANKEEVVGKIQKLLKLGSSPFDEEAKTALHKARELMLKYHIEEHDLQEEQKEEVETRSIVVDKAVVDIYAMIARNNRCEAYVSTRHKGYRKTEYHAVIVGFKFDVDCVETMGQFITNCFKNGLQQQRAKLKYQGEIETTRGFKAYYHNGFVKGLKKAFDEQNSKNEYHLMVITPEEVKDKMDSLNLCKRVFHGVSNPSYCNGRDMVKAHEAGYSDGYSAGKSSGRAELTS